MRFNSDSDSENISVKGTSQKGHSIAHGYSLPFLFSGAVHSEFLHT